MATININGVTYTGNSIRYSNGKVIIDGKTVDGSNMPIINIKVEGNINQLEVDNAEEITVIGNVTAIETTNGNVKVNGNILENATSINGNINATTIMGKATTKNGNIRYKN